MAISCTKARTELALRTPVYDQIFLEDYKPLNSPYIGRHETMAWPTGTGDTHVYDKIEMGQVNLNTPWQRINALDCQSTPCSPPIVFVDYGTTRNSYFQEQIQLRTQDFCLTQLLANTNPQAQFALIMKYLKTVPEQYLTDYIRVHAFDLNTTVQICGSAFNTFTPIPGTNVGGQLTTLNLGNDTLLPQSELTWNYLQYLTEGNLGLQGYYEGGSGLPMGMYNLITHPRTWFKLTNGNESLKNMMALTDSQQASPLYKIGHGVQQPYGNLAPTLDEQQIRFQRVGAGLLERVYPYTNVATTTGVRRTVNTAYVNARYALSYIWHPKAIRIWTATFGKIHPDIPSINSAFWGQWMFVNPEGVILTTNTDGTTCTKDNSDQRWFFWLCNLQQGFQFMYPEWIMPILHLVDGSGKDCTINQPVCGDAPQYVQQTYTDNPAQCS